MGEPLDPDLARPLYAELPEAFVTARNALAARLKAEGDPEAAAQVRALRKPSVAAWAVDRVARERPADLEALLRAGEDLASAQRRVGSGGGADRLREATEERRRLVEGLVRAAGEALEGAGLPAARATLDKVTDTLMALVSDPEAAERVRLGLLDRELPAPAGFGDAQLDAALLASVTELPRREASDEASAAPAQPSPQQRRKEEARVRHVERLEQAARKLEAEAVHLERAATEADRAASAARRTAATARRKAEAARRRADEAAG